MWVFLLMVISALTAEAQFSDNVTYRFEKVITTTKDFLDEEVEREDGTDIPQDSLPQYAMQLVKDTPVLLKSPDPGDSVSLTISLDKNYDFPDEYLSNGTASFNCDDACRRRRRRRRREDRRRRRRNRGYISEVEEEDPAALGMWNPAEQTYNCDEACQRSRRRRRRRQDRRRRRKNRSYKKGDKICIIYSVDISVDNEDGTSYGRRHTKTTEVKLPFDIRKLVLKKVPLKDVANVYVFLLASPCYVFPEVEAIQE